MSDVITEKRFVFVDIETTGLDPNRDVPLELGIKVTNENLEILGEWSSLIRDNNWRAKIAANPYVFEMHTKSGLIAEIDALPGKNIIPDRKRSGAFQYVNFDSITVSFLAYLWLTDDMGLQEDHFPMVGSSVHFDRSFALQHLGVFTAFFNYRNIDISTLKELCKVVHPELAAKIAADPKFDKKNTKHRVLDDIDNSIAELRVYMDNFLWLPDAQPTLPGM